MIMRWAIAALFLLVTHASAAEVSVDARYDALVARATADASTVDFDQLRDLYAQSSYYHGHESDPLEHAAAGLSGKPLTDAEVQDILKKDFALPGNHLFALSHFKGRLGDADIALHRTVLVKLIEAIAKTGPGIDEAHAMKVLAVSEEYLMMSALKIEHSNQALVTSKDKTHFYDVFDAKLKNGRVFKMWFDITQLMSKKP